MTRAEKIILALCGIGGLLFAFALKAFGGECIVWTNQSYRTVTMPAGDGANEIIRQIDLDGNVLSEAQTLVHVVPKVTDEETRRFCNGDDDCYVSKVMFPSLDEELIFLSKSEWRNLTNTIERLKDMSAKRWNMEHRTVAGREAWHGKATNRVISATSVTWLYADGYTYTETEENAKRARNVHKAPHFAAGARNPAAPAKKPSPTLPPRLAEKREAEKSRAGKAREVNAVFGPGGKVLKVEEVK